jgi:hypothetical protein
MLTGFRLPINASGSRSPVKQRRVHTGAAIKNPVRLNIPDSIQGNVVMILK